MSLWRDAIRTERRQLWNEVHLVIGGPVGPDAPSAGWAGQTLVALRSPHRGRV